MPGAKGRQAGLPEATNALNGHWNGVRVTAHATPEAEQWEGWGTALKPAWEPIILARKPLEGTLADNVLRHGTGAININGTSIPVDPNDPINDAVWTTRESRINPGTVGFCTSNDVGDKRAAKPEGRGRWPANFIHDGGPEVEALLPVDSLGSVGRFFYCPKASPEDREEGLGELPLGLLQRKNPGGMVDSPEGQWEPVARANWHPTVKPTNLMRYCCRLITPPNGLILDPFTGSGSTGKAALLEGFRFVGAEITPEYIPIIRGRLAWAVAKAAEASGIMPEVYIPGGGSQLGLFA